MKKIHLALSCALLLYLGYFSTPTEDTAISSIITVEYAFAGDCPPLRPRPTPIPEPDNECSRCDDTYEECKADYRERREECETMCDPFFANDPFYFPCDAVPNDCSDEYEECLDTHC